MDQFAWEWARQTFEVQVRIAEALERIASALEETGDVPHEHSS